MIGHWFAKTAYFLAVTIKVNEERTKRTKKYVIRIKEIKNLP